MDPKSSPESNTDTDQPIAWRAVPQDTAVRSEGQEVGTLYDLLGSDEEDIFHGLRVLTLIGISRDELRERWIDIGKILLGCNGISFKKKREKEKSDHS